MYFTELVDSGWELYSVAKASQLASQLKIVEKMSYMATAEVEKAKCEAIVVEGERDRARKEKRVALERVRVLEGERDREKQEKRQALERVRVLEGERDREREGKGAALEQVRVMERERDQAREERRAALEQVQTTQGERDREREEKRVALERVQVLEGERDKEQEDKQTVKVLGSEATRSQEIERTVREMEQEKARVESERDRARVDLQQALAKITELQQRVDLQDQRERENQVVREQAAAAERRGPSWIVRPDELELSNEEIGCGGWGKIKVAKLKVAAKVLHRELAYDNYQQQFRREMDVAARICHPNLLRFLGARLDGGMVILTEFMSTSLRALVNRRPKKCLPKEYILSIATDIACALSYLHNLTPDPIIHRDLSSGNVLLQPSPSGGWLAKISDYSTANFQSQLLTVNPGSPLYTAPESNIPALQTTKMDIYSFGVLLIEMWTCDLPVPDNRMQLIESINLPQMVNLIRQCMNEDKDQRPTAAQLVHLLKAMY